MYRQQELNLTPEEILDYLRKSQSDDPNLTVEEVLEKHERKLDEWDDRFLNGRVPEHNRFREIVSGETLRERPEINKILRLIESPKYKAVKIVEPQRLTRGDLEDIGRVMKLFKLTNTLIITPDRVYDLRDEYDWKIFEGELKQGNDYLTYYKRIQKRGKDLSVADGWFIGSVAPYGFDKTKVIYEKRKRPTLKENKAEADVVRLVFDLFVNQNMTPHRICRHLEELGFKPRRAKHWNVTPIKEMLANVHYIGKVRWNMRKHVSIVENGEIRKTRPFTKDDYVEYEGKHDGIVPKELFFAARDRLGRNPRVTSRVKVRNPFAGLLYCRCGKSMVYKHPKKEFPARLNCPDQPYCSCGSCHFYEIVNRVSEVLASTIEDFEIKLNESENDSAKAHEQLIRTLEKKLCDLDARELSQWKAQSDPDESLRMPAAIFKKLNENLQEERKTVQQALKKAYETMPEPEDYEKKIYKFRDALNALNDPDVDAETKNALLKSCIDRIDYYRERPQRKQSIKGNGTFPMIGNQWTTPPIELDIHLRV